MLPNTKSRSLPKPKPKPKSNTEKERITFLLGDECTPFGDPPEVIEGFNFWRICFCQFCLYSCVLWVCTDVFLKQKLTLVVGYNSNCECGREILVRTKILSYHLKGIQREVLVPAFWEADLWVKWDEPEEGTLELCLQTNINIQWQTSSRKGTHSFKWRTELGKSAGTRAVLRKLGKFLGGSSARRGGLGTVAEGTHTRAAFPGVSWWRAGWGALWAGPLSASLHYRCLRLSRFLMSSPGPFLHIHSS